VAQHVPRWLRPALPAPPRANNTLSHTNAIAPTTIPNRDYLAADPLTQYGEAVIGAARTVSMVSTTVTATSTTINPTMTSMSSLLIRVLDPQYTPYSRACQQC
jgi:hypothetical protein